MKKWGGFQEGFPTSPQVVSEHNWKELAHHAPSLLAGWF